MKAIKVTTDNKISVVDIEEPSLNWMQQHVGGHIEIVRPYGLYELEVPCSENLCMICNEEGYLLDLDVNVVTSDLYNCDGNSYWDILGDVLIMAEGFVNGEPDIVGLTEEQVQALKDDLKKKFKFLTEA